jgi:hypothetical protein
MAQRLPDDFREFLELLASANVDYLVVGGFAVAHHGYPRPTGDLEIWVSTDAANAARVAEVIRRFGFASAGVEPRMFEQAGQVIRMGVPPVRIEVLTSISGVDFTSCAARAVECVLDGVPVRVISRGDLIANKRAAGRAKDLNDLENLQQ